jgi:hypothetical protein
MGLGSGIRKKSIPDPGSRGQKVTGSGSATLVLRIRIRRICIFFCHPDPLVKDTDLDPAVL